MNCININSEEFKKLQQETKLPTINLEIIISKWQENNNSYDFPTKEYILKDSSINYQIRSINILQSDKAKQVFAKGEKNNWDLNKILTELAIPKEQKQLLLDLGIKDREKLAIELASKYGYTVEIKTAKEKGKDYEMVDRGDGNFEPEPIEPEFNYEEVLDEEGNIIDMRPVLTEKGKKQIADMEDIKPTQYYSNLTVPGGTNYTENEIATPAITPSIKGHAQFASENGIGWFRSDDKLGDKYQVKATRKDNGVEQNMSQNMSLNEAMQVAESFRDRFDNVRLVKYEEGDSIKTRRILEVQSDLFQKGREKSNLIDKKPNESRDLVEQTPFENTWQVSNSQIGVIESGFKTKEEAEKWLKAPDVDNKNQFLQLLNKGSNWVTFFVKSIIQDSAKKGYEKVLFPSGNTASKVEGHTTLEEFKKQKEDRIKELEKQKENGTKTVERYLTDEAGQPYSSVDVKIDEEIAQLKQELEKVEKEGFGALRPIYNFYENTVTNILKKQGFNPTLITDEYGNTWNEVTITEKELETVFLKLKEDKNTLSINDLSIKDKYFPNGNTNTVSDILKRVVASKHPLNTLAKHLLKYSDNLSTVIELTSDSDNRLDKKAAAHYSRNLNTILIKGDIGYGPNGVESTILHEIIHALSVRELRFSNSKEVKELEEMYEYAKKHMDPELYGLTDKYEFVAELFTSANFISKLKEVPAINNKEYKNFFQEFFDKVLQLLGISKNTTLYHQAFALATNIIESQAVKTELEIQALQLEEEVNSIEMPTFTQYTNEEIIKLIKRCR